MELRIKTEHIEAYGYREAVFIALINSRANLSRINNNFNFGGNHYAPITIDQITSEYSFISARRATVSKMISKLKKDGILEVRHIFGGRPCYRINTDITPAKPEIIEEIPREREIKPDPVPVKLPSIVSPPKQKPSPISAHMKDSIDLGDIYKDLVNRKYFQPGATRENIHLMFRKNPKLTFERVFQAIIAYKATCDDPRFIQAGQNFFDQDKGQVFGILDDLERKGFSSLIPGNRINHARGALRAAAHNDIVKKRGINLTEEIIASMIGRIKEERVEAGIDDFEIKF